MSFKEKIKEEIKHMGSVTLYFFFCFAVILMLKKLFLASYQIEFFALSSAVLGALVIGKVVVVLDNTSIGNRFRSGPLYIDVAYRSFIYTVAVFIVMVIERSFHAYSESGNLISAVIETFEGRDVAQFWATTLCVFLTFIGYEVVAAISRYMGEGELAMLFFSTNSKEND